MKLSLDMLKLFLDKNRPFTHIDLALLRHYLDHFYMPILAKIPVYFVSGHLSKEIHLYIP